MLEKTLESSLDSKEIQAVHPKGNQSWIFIGRTDAEAETPILWPPDTKNWLIRKDPEAGKDWSPEEKGTTEDEMAGWHHWLNGHEWVWASSGSWWWTWKPGVLQSMGSQIIGQNWVTALTNWLTSMISNCLNLFFVIHIGLEGRAFTLQIRNWGQGKTFMPRWAPTGSCSAWVSAHTVPLCFSSSGELLLLHFPAQSSHHQGSYTTLMLLP